MDEKTYQDPHPTVLRWNIDDDHYKDGMTLHADGSLHINVGGYVKVRSLRGWFESEKEAEKLRAENAAMKKLAGELFESGNQIKNVLVVPRLLGERASVVIDKAIDRFKAALAKAKEAGIDTGGKNG